MLKERGIITNDNTRMVPQTGYEGRVLKYDFPGLLVGIAEYKEGPTGCTVFYFPKDAISVADVLYSATTNEVETSTLDVTDLGVIASELAWDAILSCFQGYDSSGDNI
jgi:hypothetical protein